MSSKHSVGSMPYEIKNGPNRFIINTKENKITKNYKKLDTRPYQSRSSRLKLKSPEHKTMGKNTKLISQFQSQHRIIQPSFENIVSKFNGDIREKRKQTKKHVFSPVQGKISSRSDNHNYLTWTNIEQPAQPQKSLSFNPFSTEQSEIKRIKKNVKLKEVSETNILVPSKTEIKSSKVNSSIVGFKRDKTQTHVSNTSRFLGMVMINSEILKDAKDKNDKDDEKTREGNIKR